MENSLVKINPDLLALIEGKSNLLLPFVKELLVLECQVAGTSHQPVKDIEPTIVEGNRFILQREPENEFDAFAVAIYTAAQQKLGYLPRDKNESVARLMDAGKMIFASLIKKEWLNDWLKLYVQVYLVDH